MRRRRAINVWPAFADLMTVLAVPSLITAIGLFPYFVRNDDQGEIIRSLKARIQNLERMLGNKEEELQEERGQLEGMRLQMREAAKNEEMFRAIQKAQDFVRRIEEDRNLIFGTDQSLQFGDDLVSFEINSVEPIWKTGSRERLRTFCTILSTALATMQGNSVDLRNAFTVHVEGHTDSTQCPEDPNCNWWISSGRAAAFLAVMRHEELCPGGKYWNLQAIGYADSKPLMQGATRRIALRLVPNYEAIIAKHEE